MNRQAKVLSAGIQTLCQDIGRSGYARDGVSTAGVYDRIAAARANTLVGNDPTDAVLECLLGGLTLQFNCDVLVAAHDDVCAQPISAGECFTVPKRSDPLRTYVAVTGGWRLPAVLGSRSTDTLSGLGPLAISTDDVLPIGIDLQHEPAAVPPLPNRSLDTLHALWSPALAQSDIGSFTQSPWTVLPESDRSGMRLRRPGAPCPPRIDGRSQPMERGSIEWLGNGDVVVIGPDGPVTGGYPIIGAVVDDDLDLLGQLRPGATVSLASATT